MSTQKSIVFFLIFVISSPLMAEEAPVDMQAFNVTCPAAKLIPVLDTAYHECNNGYVKKGASCEKFVAVFKQLLPEYDCQRPFDTSPTQKYIVPAIWLAGDGADEDYIRLLWRMASKKGKMYRNQWFRKPVYEAKILFASKEFRHILDGAIAEEYVSRSKKMERELRKAASQDAPRLQNSEDGKRP